MEGRPREPTGSPRGAGGPPASRTGGKCTCVGRAPPGSFSYRGPSRISSWHTFISGPHGSWCDELITSYVAALLQLSSCGFHGYSYLGELCLLSAGTRLTGAEGRYEHQDAFPPAGSAHGPQHCPNSEATDVSFRGCVDNQTAGY